MNTYADLLKQRADLDKQIEEVRQNEIKAALAQARALVAQYGLTADDLFGGVKARSANRATKATGKVAAKYKDPSTGATWTGRGKAPKWIDGKSRDQFLI
jgi:DNA-binding protein H-NS